MNDQFDLLYHDPRFDDRSTQELIRAALHEIGQAEAFNAPALWALRHRGTQDVFEAAQALCISPAPLERKLGVSILAVLGIPERSFPEESLQIVLELLEQEQEQEVLAAICTSLAHMADLRAIEPITRLKDHPNIAVRFGVVFALVELKAPECIPTLIELAQDEADDVRDWATFGLGSVFEEYNTSEIREALYQNIDDPHEHTRYEALMGLARRKDGRIVKRVLDELWSGKVTSDSVTGEVFCHMLRRMQHDIEDSRLLELLEKCNG